MASIVLTGAIARFVPLGSAIAGGSPRSLRFLVTAAAGPSQGNMGEDAPPMSTKEDEVTSARRTWRRRAEASPVMQPVRWQTSGTKHPVWPEMHGDPPKEPPRRRRTDFVSSKAQQAKESIKDNVNDLK